MTTIAKDERGVVMQVVALGPTQKITVAGTSAQSSAVGSDTQVVRLVATTDCHVAIGSNPTATTNSAFFPSGSVEYVKVAPGNKVAVIQASAGGFLFVTEGL